MTVSNGTVCPHPLANPFNTRMIGNYSLNPYANSYYKQYVRNDPHAQLPQPKMLGQFEMEGQKLEVPNQLDVPNIGVQQIDRVALSQMYPNNYVAPDGTIYDLDSKRIVFKPGSRHCQNGEWAPCRNINVDNAIGSREWNDREIYSPPTPQRNDQHVDAQSQKYWDEVNSKKQEKQTDLQKELMGDLEKFVGQSKLVDDE